MSLEKFFHLKENNTTVKTEIMAGVTSFMTMAYILAVNPNILAAAGMDHGAVFTATAVASSLSYAGSTLHERCDCGSTKTCTAGCSDCIRKERALDPRELSVSVQHVCLCRYTDERSECIKEVNKEEREHDHDELKDRNAL